jgi:hypothetical protein
MVSFLQVSPPQPCMHFPPSPQVPHALPISSSPLFTPGQQHITSVRPCYAQHHPQHATLSLAAPSLWPHTNSFYALIRKTPAVFPTCTYSTHWAAVEYHRCNTLNHTRTHTIKFADLHSGHRHWTLARCGLYVISLPCPDHSALSVQVRVATAWS